MYKFLYYRIYRWCHKFFGVSEIPEINGLLILSLFTFSNGLALVLLVDKLCGTHLFELLFSSKASLIVLAGLNLLVNYLLLMWRGEHKRILRQFESWENDKIRSKNLFAYGYFIFSIVILIVSVIVTLSI